MGGDGDFSIGNQIISTAEHCCAVIQMYDGESAFKNQLCFEKGLKETIEQVQHFLLIPNARSLKKFCRTYCVQAGNILNKNEIISTFGQKIKQVIIFHHFSKIKLSKTSLSI